MHKDGKENTSAIKRFQKYMYQFHFKGGVLKIAPEIPGVPWNTV
jgi:hypothetical protein